MTNIGFIGLGRMGRPMAINLQKKGFSLKVLDINPQAVAALVAAGAQAAASVADIARQCRVVITMLPTSVEVEQVALGPGGIFANSARGTVLMDMSTIDPLATDRLQGLAQAAGMSMVDAPVGRLAEHADRGESLFMVGASEADFATVKPLLDAMGTTVHHCGAVGTGGRTKLVNNYLAISLCQLNGEALALSQRFGLDLTNTLQVLSGTSANNNQLRINFTTVSRGSRDKGDRGYLAERLQSANWLVRSMHQRATTILRVAAEIVRQQHGFFVHGVSHLRPLVLRDIAAAVSLHESTISRVTSNKYIATPRGIFELKYFFTASIQSVDGGAAHSAEAVRHRIRTMIDGEAADRVLSDDQIVGELQRDGVDIARRTVAKYREAMRIPSSVERRRAKWAPA